jgi:hypothetical protein
MNNPNSNEITPISSSSHSFEMASETNRRDDFEDPCENRPERDQVKQYECKQTGGIRKP